MRKPVSKADQRKNLEAIRPSVEDLKNTIRCFLSEDEEILKEQLKDLAIELIDTGQSKQNQTAWLKKETASQVLQGRAVIYAWCYSIFSMCEADADAPKMVVDSNQAVEIAKTIASLVGDYYRWVPRVV